MKLNRKQMAEHLGISVMTLRRKVSKGQIKEYKDDTGKAYYIVEQVNNLLEQPNEQVNNLALLEENEQLKEQIIRLEKEIASLQDNYDAMYNGLQNKIIRLNRIIDSAPNAYKQINLN